MGKIFLSKIRSRFLAGLTVVIPGALTIFIIVWLLKEINLIFNPFSVFLENYIHIYIPDAGLMLLLILILASGYLITNLAGRSIVNFYENVMLKIPLVNLFYKSTKQWVDIFSPGKSSFKKFVLVKYNDDKFIYGFLTSATGIKTGGKDEYAVVYIPTNHLYIGMNIIAKKEDVIDTGLKVEQGIQIVLSAGIAFPDSL
jgi:uncharacterized membrane protein